MKKITSIISTLLIVAFAALALLLAGSVVPFAGYQIRLVTTGSMTPAMPVGTAVFVKARTHYSVGEVITFERSGEKIPTTHRIVADSIQAGEIYYTTRGDANDAPDQLPVAQSEVLGAVWLSVPYLGYVLDFARRPAGFALLVGVPLAWVIGEDVLRRRRSKVLASASTPLP